MITFGNHDEKSMKTMTAIKVITTTTKSTADNNYDNMTNKNIKRNIKEDNED